MVKPAWVRGCGGADRGQLPATVLQPTSPYQPLQQRAGAREKNEEERARATDERERRRIRDGRRARRRSRGASPLPVAGFRATASGPAPLPVAGGERGKGTTREATGPG